MRNKGLTPAQWVMMVFGLACGLSTPFRDHVAIPLFSAMIAPLAPTAAAPTNAH